MSQVIKRAICEAFNIPWVIHRQYEEDKDSPMDIFNGQTYRQVQISFSEDWLKPQFGDDILGHIMQRQLKQQTVEYAILDCGFREEIIPVIDAYARSNVLIIQLEREGCSFDGDSRSYIDADGLHGVKQVRINNQHDIELYEAQICRCINEWQGIKE